MPKAMPQPRGRRPRLRLVIEPHASEDLRHAISDRLDLFNVATTGLDAWHSVAVLLRGPNDEIVGGILGDIWGGWLHVTYLWVAAPYRGHGYGRELVRAAERFAVERGCRAARLETFSFQAPGLYEKLGYQVFGVLDDCPPGHKQFFLRRNLSAPGGDHATSGTAPSARPKASGRAKRAGG